MTGVSSFVEALSLLATGGLFPGTGAPPLRTVKVSRMTPVESRKVASRLLPFTSRTSDPRTLREINMTGWFSEPPPVWPELPATVYTAPRCGPSIFW